MSRVIPNAKDFVVGLEQKKKASLVEKHKQEEIEAEIQRRWVERLSGAVSQMIEYLTENLCKAIQMAQQSKIISSHVTFSLSNQSLGLYAGIPGDVLLYGHRPQHESWQVRTPLELPGPTAFQRLQREFFKNGWYLIEESDPSRSRNLVFSLYWEKPGADHHYFNKTGVVWHNHNLFDETEFDTEDLSGDH